MGRETSRATLRRGDDILGLIEADGDPGGHVSGLFVPGPDFDRYRSLFDRLFEMQRRVDESPDGDYQAAWYEWNQALEAIEALGLVYGPEAMPVEGFEIDDRWRISFGPPLWWIVATDEGPDN